jgi:hypothetical protein
VRAVVAEQDDPQPAFLVPKQRLPGAVAIDLNRLGRQHVVDRLRVTSGQTEGGQEPERDGPPVREAVVRGSLERMTEGMAEVERVARAAVVRVA